MRFFLGGVPFGCDNIGDEAILAAIVSILRRNFENPEITVSTADPEGTSARLGVECVPLYVFRKDLPIGGLREALSRCDAFVWAGATGLSDYPETALDILSEARKAGLKTVVWGVGMNSRLNPAFYSVRGKKLALCRLLGRLCFGAFDFAAALERGLAARTRARIASELRNCRLLVARDEATRRELLKCSADLDVTVGADSAVIFDAPDLSRLEALGGGALGLLEDGTRKIGLCVSSQGAVSDLRALAACLDSILEPEDRRLFFIPMNPKTDSGLMRAIRPLMARGSRAFDVGCLGPEDVVAAASRCDVVVSSRLHLLILSANVSTPIVGIARGSKVDNFLGAFGLESAGTVDDCDFAALAEGVERGLAGRKDFARVRDAAYAGFGERLSAAEKKLARALGD